MLITQGLRVNALFLQKLRTTFSINQMLNWNQFRLSHSCLVLWDDCFDFTSAT